MVYHASLTLRRWVLMTSALGAREPLRQSYQLLFACCRRRLVWCWKAAERMWSGRPSRRQADVAAADSQTAGRAGPACNADYKWEKNGIKTSERRSLSSSTPPINRRLLARMIARAHWRKKQSWARSWARHDGSSWHDTGGRDRSRIMNVCWDLPDRSAAHASIIFC